MPKLALNLEGRVRRLPKPHSSTAALQPVFEAVMNGLQAVESTKGEGTVTLSISGGVISLFDKTTEIVVSDDGPGLDSANWEAFCELDTLHKANMGGKGIGRLLWLAAFEDIQVESVHHGEGHFERTTFRFVLDNREPIANLQRERVAPTTPTGLQIRFRAIKEPYLQRLATVTPDELIVTLAGHFWAQLRLASRVNLRLQANGQDVSINKHIRSIVVRDEDVRIDDHERGAFQLYLAECKKTITKTQKRRNYLIAAAHRRAVKWQPLDDLLGIEWVSEEPEQTVFVGLLEGAYLDANVNQERSAFTFETEKDLNELIKEVCLNRLQVFLDAAIARERAKQAEALARVLDLYPSLRMEPDDKLLEKLKPSHKEEDEIYSALSIYRYRADQKRRKAVDAVLKDAQDAAVGPLPQSLANRVQSTLAEVDQASRNQLTEFVIRRRELLNLLDVLIERRQDNGKLALEQALHSLIVEPRCSTIGAKAAPLAHDLWILDENLTFARYVTSDQRLDSFIATADGNGKANRPDIAVFDQAIVFGTGDPLGVIYLVEFKRPLDAAVQTSIERQINRYVKALRSGTIRGPGDRPLRMVEKPFFHVLVVADIEGALAEEMESWDRAPDGFGRIRAISGNAEWRGKIEIIPWDRLIARARERHRAFFEQLGLGRHAGST